MNPRRPDPRITGIETEYGCLIDNPEELGNAVHRIRNWVFENQRYGLIDQHYRDWEEPPGNGGFLFNGGRLYLDMGHVEYCTPECGSAADVVRYIRAGDQMLHEAVQALGFDRSVHLIRNNIDHHSGATFGCHENYSMLRDAPVSQRGILGLLTFLTLRVLFAGAGRVGAARGRYLSSQRGRDDPADFQLSQRADYIENDLYEWVQHNRAIINTRDEPLADPRLYRRLHLLHGDSQVLPAAQYLTVGSTRLMLDLLEHGQIPKVALADAVGTLRALSRNPQGPWKVKLEDGRECDAVELLSRFRLRAREAFLGRDEETDALLALWERVEHGLACDLADLVGIVDWATKRHLLETFRESEKLEWNSPWLQAQDLEYHQVDPSRSLGLALADLSGPWAKGLADPVHTTAPPTDTRAAARSRWMRGVAGTGKPYEIDWHACRTSEDDEAWLLDPFATKI